MDSPRVPWSELEVLEQVGEGASGLVFRARWLRTAGEAPEEVAVKIFKGGTTSDGLPESEMEITAGTMYVC